MNAKNARYTRIIYWNQWVFLYLVKQVQITTIPFTSISFNKKLGLRLAHNVCWA